MSYILHERKKNSSLGFIRGGKLSPVFWVFREGVFFVGGFFFPGSFALGKKCLHFFAPSA
jgi:hypothetical protein